MNRIFTVLILLCTFTIANAQVSAWQFGVPASLGNEASYNATTTAANSAISVLTRGGGITPSALARAFSSTGFAASGTKANAIATNQYFAFSLTANPGYQLSLSTLDAKIRRSATGPNMYIWQYSTNGVNFFDIGSDVSYNLATADGDVQPQLNLSVIPALQNVLSGTVVYFRLYAWGASAVGGTFAIGRYGTGISTNSLEIGGTVTVPCVPFAVSIASTPPSNVICEGQSTTLQASGGVTYTWNPGNVANNPVTFTPVATTTYTVIAADANNCTSTSSVTITVNSTPAPTPVTASPNTFCGPGTSNLNATSAGNTISWYTVPSGGSSIGTSASGVNFSVSPVATTTYYAESVAPGGGTQTFNYTGGMQTFTVPAGVTAVTLLAKGAQGGNGNIGAGGGVGGNGGLGSSASGILTVTPGDVLNIFVGGQGTTTGGFNGGGNGGNLNAGGGGGASDLRLNSVAIAARVIVGAGGGGGGTGGCAVPGVNGGNGGHGNANGTNGVTSPNGGGGFAASGASGGAAGIGCGGFLGSPGLSAGNEMGAAGGAGQGCCCASTPGGGGGGGGQVGGGGGGGGSAGTVGCSGNDKGGGGGGAGGASSTGSLASPALVTGIQSGNGQVVITWSGSGCASASRTPVTVTINPLPLITASASPAAICLGGSSVLTGTNGVSYVWNPGGLTGSPVVSPIATTIYTVEGTDANGCTATSTVEVVVNGIPAVTASASAATICIGGSSTLTGGGATSYAWDPGALVGSPTVSPIATTNYTVTGTDANGCTATSTVDVVVNGLPVVTANPATQTVCEMGMATVSGGGAVSYAWTGGITDATPFMVMAPAVYTVTGTDANGCTNTATAEVLMNAMPVITASATPSTTCEITSVMPSASGAATIAWSGGLTNNVPFVATATTTYTVTGTDGNGCTNITTILLTVNPMSGILAPATSNQAQDHSDDFDINYYNAACDLIATVDDGAGGNVLGMTTSTVNVDATAGMHNGQPFVRRWYQITPTTNGAADVVLYINQSDFDDYNGAVLLPYLPLPIIGNNADPNIANIRITKNDDAGLGNNPVVITPAVNWNGTYWELSFNTPNFSQFRVHSVNPGNVPLPVTITHFSGLKLETSDKLSWTTSSEQNNAYFNLQHSTDGTHFTTLAKVNSKAPNGNSATPLTYTHTNTNPKMGHNYYRLQQTDLDNKLSVHAQIVDLIWGANGSTVSIYPNPTTDILNIDLYAATAQNTTVKLLDMSGRVIKQIQAKSAVGMNHIKLSMGEIASGVYTIQVYENNMLSHTSKVKKN